MLLLLILVVAAAAKMWHDKVRLEDRLVDLEAAAASRAHPPVIPDTAAREAIALRVASASASRRDWETPPRDFSPVPPIDEARTVPASGIVPPSGDTLPLRAGAGSAYWDAADAPASRVDDEAVKPSPWTIPPVDADAPRVAAAPRAVSGPSIVPQAPRSLEDLFGRTLPIWAGGITLAIAGILVVKWSVDVGLLSPVVRLVLGMLFGIGLVGGAEVALRRDVADARIPQALAGAGVVTLYACVLAANMLYGLVGDGVALIGLAAVSVAAGAASMRFGSPSAVLGLIGGLLAPALIVSGEPNVPLLSLYVGFMSLGTAWIARIQQRTWLGGVAMAGAATWAFVMCLMGSEVDTGLSVGMLVILIGFGIPAILPDDESGRILRTVGGVLAVVQTTALVSMGGFGLVQWSMMAAATAGLLLTSEREASFRDSPIAAFGLFAMLLFGWRDPSPMGLAAVVVVFSLMHAVHAIRRLAFMGSPREIDALRLVGLPIVACAAAHFHFMDMPDALLSLTYGLAAASLAGAVVLTMRCGLFRVADLAQPAVVAMGAVAIGVQVPRELLPSLLLVASVGFMAARGWKVAALAAAVGTVAWFVPILGMWSMPTLYSLSSGPLLTGSLPGLWPAVWMVLPGIMAAMAVSIRTPSLAILARGYAVVAGMVFVHILWRHLLPVDTAADFTSLGMVQRTGWELLLGVVAILASRFDARAYYALTSAALLHFAWFTLLRFNPFWYEQAVGAFPVLNMVTFSHGVVLWLLWYAGRVVVDPTLERFRKTTQMVVILSLGAMTLRQIMCGSVFADYAVTDFEDILRSVGLVGAAIGFLLYGARTDSIEWRAGSLMVMLAAVTKVFAFDAAGLDGLARVASFAALGFSLIGIGWLYSRMLTGAPQTREV